MTGKNFKAAPFLSNPHVQTLCAYYLRPVAKLACQRQQLNLADGDFVDIDLNRRASAALNTNDNANTPLVIMLHGLEGSSESTYMRAMMWQFEKLKWRVIGVNMRGCSGRINKLAIAYNACEQETLNSVLQFARQQFAQAPIFALGFSLGGSILLNYLSAKNCPITAACAISAPYDLQAAAEHMQYGIAKMYRNFFIKSLKSKVYAKRQLYRELKLDIDWRRLSKCKSFLEFDDLITAPHNGFQSAADYYRQGSVKHKLKQITTPTLLIHAQDDPFMTAACAPHKDLINPNTSLAVSATGGHVGFIDKRYGFSWHNLRTADFFQQHI